MFRLYYARGRSYVTGRYLTFSGAYEAARRLLEMDPSLDWMYFVVEMGSVEEKEIEARFQPHTHTQGETND